MAVFAYRARDMRGAEIRGTLLADSKQAAYAQLDGKALLPLDLTETSQPAIGGRVGLGQLAGFYGQLADLLRAGVPILRSLDLLSRQRGKGAFGRVLGELRDAVAAGESLAETMGKHGNVFPNLHVAMVNAGEKGGFLEDVLTNLGSFVEKQNELRSKVIASMIYPAVLVTLGIGVMILIVTFLVPKFEPMLANSPTKLWATDVLFWVSNLLSQHFVAVFAGLVFVVGAIVAYARSEQGKRVTDRAVLRMPLLGPVLTMVNLGRFCRMLGTLLRNGIPILAALQIARDSANNSVLADQINLAIDSVRRGDTLAGPLATSGMFPLDIVDMIAVGEESNQLDNVLVKIADTQEARTSRKVETLVRLVEPILLVAIAAVMAFVIMALLVPVMTSSSMIK